MANTTNLDLVKPAGTDHALISVLNSNSDKIDAFAGQTNDSLSAEQNGLAYIVGNTNTTGGTLAVGQFVYVKGHSTIAEGLRKVTSSISANGSITTSNTDACSEGGLNALNSNKINTSAIKNNLTTTSAGYVLDARQGKALNDKIVTSAKTTFTPTCPENVSVYSNGCYYYKTGNVVSLHMYFKIENVSTTGNAGLKTVTHNLPSSVEPKFAMPLFAGNGGVVDGFNRGTLSPTQIEIVPLNTGTTYFEAWATYVV